LEVHDLLKKKYDCCDHLKRISYQIYRFEEEMIKYITVQWFLISKRAFLCLKVPILHTCLPSEKSSIQRKMHMQHWWKDSGIKNDWKRKCAWDV